MLHPCAEPACAVLLPAGTSRCPAHAKVQDLKRGTAQERGYTSRWATRAALFRKAYPLCGMRPEGQTPVGSRCYEEGRITPATEVDHIIPHRGNPDLFWDEINNWGSLCGPCHKAKTGAGL